LLEIVHVTVIIFYTLSSKGSRGLKTKVKNVAGMAVRPGILLLLLFFLK